VTPFRETADSVEDSGAGDEMGFKGKKNETTPNAGDLKPLQYRTGSEAKRTNGAALPS
jgi:hypothetical protein